MEVGSSSDLGAVLFACGGHVLGGGGRSWRRSMRHAYPKLTILNVSLPDVRRSLHSCYAHEGNRYVRLTREQLDERRMLCFGRSRFDLSESQPSQMVVRAVAACGSAVGDAVAGESAVGAAAAGESAVVAAPAGKRQKIVPVMPCVSIQLACILNEELPEEGVESQESQESQEHV